MDHPIITLRNILKYIVILYSIIEWVLGNNISFRINGQALVIENILLKNLGVLECFKLNFLTIGAIEISFSFSFRKFFVINVSFCDVKLFLDLVSCVRGPLQRDMDSNDSRTHDSNALQRISEWIHRIQSWTKPLGKIGVIIAINNCNISLQNEESLQSEIVIRKTTLETSLIDCELSNRLELEEVVAFVNKFSIISLSDMIFTSLLGESADNLKLDGSFGKFRVSYCTSSLQVLQDLISSIIKAKRLSMEQQKFFHDEHLRQFLSKLSDCSSFNAVNRVKQESNRNSLQFASIFKIFEFAISFNQISVEFNDSKYCCSIFDLRRVLFHTSSSLIDDSNVQSMKFTIEELFSSDRQESVAPKWFELNFLRTSRLQVVESAEGAKFYREVEYEFSLLMQKTYALLNLCLLVPLVDFFVGLSMLLTVQKRISDASSSIIQSQIHTDTESKIMEFSTLKNFEFIIGDVELVIFSSPATAKTDIVVDNVFFVRYSKLGTSWKLYIQQISIKVSSDAIFEVDISIAKVSLIYQKDSVDKEVLSVNDFEIRNDAVPFQSRNRKSVSEKCIDLLNNFHRNCQSTAFFWESHLSDLMTYAVKRVCVSLQKVTVKLSGAELLSLGECIGVVTSSQTSSRCLKNYIFPCSQFSLDKISNPVIFDVFVNDVIVVMDNIDHYEVACDSLMTCNSDHTNSDLCIYTLSFSKNDKGGVFLKYNSVPGLVSKMTLFLTDDIHFSASDASGSQSFDLFQVRTSKAFRPDCSWFGMDQFDDLSFFPVFSSLKFPVEIFSGRDNYAGLGIFGEYSMISVEELNCDLDALSLHHLLICLRNYSSGIILGQSIGEQARKYDCIVDDFDRFSIDISPFSHTPVKQPLFITAIRLDSLSILCTHEHKSVVVIGGSDVECNRLSYGPSLSQFNLNITNFQVVDLTLPTACHKKIICSIQPDSPSILEMHLSSKLGEYGLLELRLEMAKVLYLQRSTMTFLNFFRDQFAASISKSLKAGAVAKRYDVRFLDVDEAISDRNRINTHEIILANVFSPRGIFRFAVSLRQCEVHLPVNSYGSESLVVITSHTYGYRSPLALESIQASHYLLTPYLSERFWLSEVYNIRTAYEGMFSELVNHSSQKIGVLEGYSSQWKLSSYAGVFLVPSEDIGYIGPQNFKMNVNVLDTIICTWCNQNAIGENINLEGEIEMYPASQEADGMYGGVFNSCGFKLAENGDKNTISVKIKCDEIDWIMSHGQYQAIIFMIFHNFSEVQQIVPDLFVAPVGKKVHLQEEVFGKYGLDRRLPLLSTVPIAIARGRIRAIEDTPDYYELVQRQIPFQENLETKFAHRVNTGLSKLSRFSLSKMLLVGAIDNVPEFSYHHRYRKKLFSKISPSALRLSQFGTKAASIYSNGSYDFEPQLGHGLISVYFENLDVDFYRRHCGGGNGIFVGVNTFIIVDDTEVSNRKASLSPNIGRGKLDFNLIPVDKIILAPKYVAQFGCRGFNNNGSRYVTYTQQGCANLRRCIVDITDCIVVARLIPIMSCIGYFVDPITLSSHRNIQILLRNGIGPLDFKGGLDVEVHSIQTVISLPYSSSYDERSLICFHGDLIYTQAWRGFLFTGPGKSMYSIEFAVHSMFVAPLKEIQILEAQTILDPCSFLFTVEFFVSPLASKLVNHLSLLSPWMEFSSWVLRANKSSEPYGIRRIIFKVSPLHHIKRHKSRNWDVNDSVDDILKAGLRIHCSSKDITFLIAVVQQTINTAKKKPDFVRRSLQDRYSVFWNNYRDILHLPLLTEFLVACPLEERWNEFDNDIQLDICNIQVVLRNNTYNLKILKLELKNFQFSYIKSSSTLHAASGLEFALFSYGDVADCWEPLIEKVSLSAIAATDASSSLPEDNVDGGLEVVSENDEKEDDSLDIVNNGNNGFPQEDFSELVVPKANGGPPRVRVEAVSSAVDINASTSAIISLVKRLSLADVVTTSSVHLPPYLVRNELGIPVDCIVRKGGAILTTHTIKAHSQLPIEILTLSAKGLKRQSTDVVTADVDDKEEHSMDIFFYLFGEKFESKKSFHIDREGTTSIEMKHVSNRFSSNPLSEDEKRRGDSRNGQYYGDSVVGSTGSMHNIVKAGGDIPNVVLGMRMKDDGGREIVLRSILSVKNHTNKPLSVDIRRECLSCQRHLCPNEEWFVPLHLAHPNSSMHLKIEEYSQWFEALPVLTNLILQGYWGAPTKLKSEIVFCPQLRSPPLNNHILLIKPQARSKNSELIPLKYPSKEVLKPSFKNADAIVQMPFDGSVMLHDAYLAGIQSTPSFSSKVLHALPMLIELSPAIQIFSIVPQPLFYRISDYQGLISSEGVLLPGEVVNIHNIARLYHQKLYVSLRIVNYGWSKWVKLFARTNPFPSEKLVEIVLSPLQAFHGDKKFVFPSLDVSMLVKENVIRFSSPITISNCSGLALAYCDDDSYQAYLPHFGALSAEKYITFPAHESSSKNLESQSMDISENEHDDDDSIQRKSVDTLSSGSIADADVDENFAVGDTGTSIVPISEPKEVKKGTIPLIIHLPNDHLQYLEYDAEVGSTLREVFSNVIAKIVINKSFQKENEFMFVPWESGVKGSMYIDFSPNTEQSLFSKNSKLESYDEEPEDDDDDEDNSVRTGIMPRRRSSMFARSDGPSLESINSQKFIDTTDSNLPPFLRLGMLFSCNRTLTSTLYMSTTVDNLPHTRLRLCHNSELSLYRQILLAESITENKSSGFISSMFNKNKQDFRVPFMPWELNDVPFSPHKFIGSATSLSLKIWESDDVADENIEADWSRVLNFNHIDAGSNSSFVSLLGQGASSFNDSGIQIKAPKRNFEISLFAENGKDLCQNSKIIYIVPKHIVISKLDFPIEVRQINTVNPSLLVRLQPRSIEAFHHPIPYFPKIVETRRMLAVGAKNDSALTSSEMWCGELDFSSIGISYVYFRNPRCIVKVQVEVLGGSFVATFSEQNLRWPPYKIVNLTSMNFRFRQSLVNVASDQSKVQDENADFGVNVDSLIENKLKHLNLEYEQLNSNSATPYAWDYPLSLRKLVCLEFHKGSNADNVEIDIEEAGTSRSLHIMRSLPAMNNPLAEGSLIFKVSNDPNHGEWTPIHCIVKGHHMFIFPENERSVPIDIVELSKLSDEKTTQLQCARVLRTQKSGDGYWNSSRFFSKNASFSSIEVFDGLLHLFNNQSPSLKSYVVDINQARILMIRVAEILGFFDKDFLVQIQCRQENSQVKFSQPATNSLSDNHLFTIKEIFESECSMDMILEAIAQRPIGARELVNAFVLLSNSQDEETALLVYQVLLENRMIVLAGGSVNVPTPSSPSFDSNDESMDISPGTSIRESMSLRPSSLRALNFNISEKTGISGKKLIPTVTLESLSRVKVCLNPPVLNPELLELTTEQTLLEDDAYEVSRYSTIEQSSENAVFSIIVSQKKIDFLCSSRVELCGWIQACRQSIELSWIDYFLERKDLFKEISMNSMKLEISLQIRADGPTKVLEVKERTTENSHSAISSLDSEEYFSVEDYSNIGSNSLLDWKANQRITDNLSVVILAPLISLSFIDSEPSEFIYLALEDIEISIERTRGRVQMGGTIMNIQVGNQNLNPLFTVTLFPRRGKTSAANLSKIIANLPGLSDRIQTFPALHLFFQEKYSSKSDLKKFQLLQESNLVYFESFLLWVAPMQLDLDEEVVVRMIRFFKEIRRCWKRVTGRPSSSDLDVSNTAETGKAMSILDSPIVSAQSERFLRNGIQRYEAHKINSPPSQSVYFSSLIIYPFDFIVHLAPTPDFPISPTESTIISFLGELDASRITLSAFVTNHTFGTLQLFSEMLGKHYRGELWKQVQNFLSASNEPEEKSLKLQSGSIDAGEDDILDSLILPSTGASSLDTIDSSSTTSFLDGISKGSKSLASKAIGSTSSITSRITGGLGRGVSLLTLDTEFQRNRTSRRLNKTTSVSQGLFVGTRELGKNIVEGVTGIVVSPYRGWESGGGIGFGVGVAKGILGVALKPAVGVFDLASRATEGLRHSASVNKAALDAQTHRLQIRRLRFPRAFGRGKTLISFNEELSAAQYLVDSLTGFPREDRFLIVHHQHFHRKVVDVARDGPQSSTMKKNYVEAWGLPCQESYLVVISSDRVALISIQSLAGTSRLNAHFVWSCPANCFDELYSDGKGDLVLNTSSDLSLTGAWNSQYPVVLDLMLQNYICFQKYLESFLGIRKSRMQPLMPVGGLIECEIQKLIKTGIRSFLATPTRHRIQLVGHVLYEYSLDVDSNIESPKDKSSTELNNSDPNKANDASNSSGVHHSTSSYDIPMEPYSSYLLNNLFGKAKTSVRDQLVVGACNTLDEHDDTTNPCPSNSPEGSWFLSSVCALVDLVVVGPHEDENKGFVLTLSGSNSQKIPVLRRETSNSLLVERLRPIIKLFFSTRERAILWKNTLSKYVVHSFVPMPFATPSKEIGISEDLASIHTASSHERQQSSRPIENILVIPSSAGPSRDIEHMKVELAKTLFYAKE